MPESITTHDDPYSVDCPQRVRDIQAEMNIQGSAPCSTPARRRTLGFDTRTLSSSPMAAASRCPSSPSPLRKYDSSNI